MLYPKAALIYHKMSREVINSLKVIKILFLGVQLSSLLKEYKNEETNKFQVESVEA